MVHRDLHVLSYSFPTRRSSDLGVVLGAELVDADVLADVSVGPELGALGLHLREAPVEELLLHLELGDAVAEQATDARSEEHTSELQSLMRISYAVFCLKKKKKTNTQTIKAN